VVGDCGCVVVEPVGCVVGWVVVVVVGVGAVVVVVVGAGAVVVVVVGAGALVVVVVVGLGGMKGGDVVVVVDDVDVVVGGTVVVVSTGSLSPAGAFMKITVTHMNPSSSTVTPTPA